MDFNTCNDEGEDFSGLFISLGSLDTVVDSLEETT